MAVNLFWILRTFLLTGHCVDSFQRPTAPHTVWLVDARQSENHLQTSNICHLYTCSACKSHFSVKQPTFQSMSLLWNAVLVIYPYSILNSALNFHSYFTLWCFRCFQCLPIPYSDIFLFCTLMFPTVFWHLSAFQCSPYSNISEILLFHSMLWHFPTFPMFSLFL